MNIKKGLLIGLAALGLSVSAQAAPINVGGVVWDPDSINSGASLQDFVAFGSVESDGNGSSWGFIDKVNNKLQTEFCPGCELTFNITPDAARSGEYVMQIMVDTSMDHTDPVSGAFDMATASNGLLWLELATTGYAAQTGPTGTSDFAFFDVIGGVAESNFDTNTLVNGHDAKLAGHLLSGQGLGQFTLSSDSIPEPTSIALLGLGLVGFAASRKRKA